MMLSFEPSTCKRMPSPNSCIACGTWQNNNASSALYAGGGRLWLDNGTRFANNSFRVGYADAIYVLPAPLGHYTNARKCEVVYAPCPSSCFSRCEQNRSLSPAATTTSGCTRPPYDFQVCPWNAFGPEILGAFPLTLTLTLTLILTLTLTLALALALP